MHMKTNQPSCGRRQAFTRGDLLVVVALILLMVAVQLPTFGNTKSGSQAGTCANNLRRLIQAWHMYADDNGGRLVPNNGADPNHPGGTWVAGWLDFTSSFDNINVAYLVGSEHTGRYGLLGPYLKRDASVFKCPADRSQVTVFGRVQARVRSISMNNWMGGTVYASQTEFKVFRGLDDLTRPEPAQALVTIEEREDSINDGAIYFDMLYNLADYPAYRHEGGAYLSFADGHVAYRNWQDSRTVAPFERVTREIVTPQIPVMRDNPDLDYLRSVATALK
jgi:prepilin-type processing-associated H-X9-DG protein